MHHCWESSQLPLKSYGSAPSDCTDNVRRAGFECRWDLRIWCLGEGTFRYAVRLPIMVDLIGLRYKQSSL